MQPESHETILVRGSALWAKQPFYAPYVAPIVLIKKTFQMLYQLLLRLLWSDFAAENQVLDPAMTALLSLVFCLLSLISYFFAQHQSLVVITLLLVWFVDRQVAQHQFYYGSQRIELSLDSKKDWVIWHQQFPDGQLKHLKFQKALIAQVQLERVAVRGGAFREKVGTVWQIYLCLGDATKLLLDEKCKTIDAIQTAEPIAASFQVPVIVGHSEGQGKYADAPIQLSSATQYPFPYPTPFPTTIQVHQNRHQWHIYACWRWISTWLLVKQLARETGFFLFILFMGNLMVHFGQFLTDWMFSHKDILTLSFNLTAGLLPVWSWKTALELGFVVIVLLIKGAQLSREEHLLINQTDLRFLRNTQPIAQVSTRDVTATLFIQSPHPALLILTPDQVIEVNELQRDVEFRAMLLALDESLTHLKSIED